MNAALREQIRRERDRRARELIRHGPRLEVEHHLRLDIQCEAYSLLSGQRCRSRPKQGSAFCIWHQEEPPPPPDPEDGSDLLSDLIDLERKRKVVSSTLRPESAR